MPNEIVVVVVIGVAFLLYPVQIYFQERSEKAELQSWLMENGLLEYEAKLHKFGIRSVTKFVQLDAQTFLLRHGAFWHFLSFSSEKEKLEQAVAKAKRELQLQFWLQQHGLDDYYKQFISHGVNTIESLVQNTLNGEVWEFIEDKDVLTLLRMAAEKFNSPTADGSIPYRSAVAFFSFSWWSFKFTVKLVSLIIVCVVSVSCLCLGVSRLKIKSRQHRLPFFPYALGLVLEPRYTSVIWDWTDPHVVGETMSFTLEFFRMNLLPYSISQIDHVLVEIMHGNTLIATSHEYGGQRWQDFNKMKVTFTVREAGSYTIAVLAQGKPIRGSPFQKTFLPGVADPSKCSILEGASFLVAQQGIYTPLTVEARDQFGNMCSLSDQDVSSYGVQVKEIGSSLTTDPELVIFPDDFGKNNVLHIKLESEGCFNAVVKYNGTTLTQGSLTILSLNAKEAEQVQKNLKKQCWNVWYEAHLLTGDEPSVVNSSSSYQAAPLPSSNRADRSHSADHATRMATTLDPMAPKKSRKVYCYISQKYLTIKEFYMKIIPHRLYAFRVRPTTKITLHPLDKTVYQPSFTVDDGSQPPVTITCKERNLLVATFSKLLLSKIGGSESFQDKRNFFYRELVAHHGRKEGEVRLKINRHKLLESSIQACKSLYPSDWLRSFNITFKDEPGLDWGGVRREWFELLCRALFAHESGFFTRFNAEDPQALVHPNPKRPPGLKLKFYEFAGRVVGKCLYESALGPSRRQNVKGRFSRSFLAQLLGLRVSYRYFESDDKDLYRSKIKYIEETDPEDLGLVFAEEEYNTKGQLEKIVELKHGGSQIPVTEANKKEYLDLLAQHRLATSIKPEIEAFAKGLNEMVPDNLLSVFDEYELELLMCGTGNISVADLRQNHAVVGSGKSFSKTLDWFWTIVTSFTQEELARLVQFITGSSQLPPGGFSELMPRLQISSAPTTDALPTAHTCFNQICLPGYSSFEETQKKLLLAINEGSEGFGFA